MRIGIIESRLNGEAFYTIVKADNTRPLGISGIAKIVDVDDDVGSKLLLTQSRAIKNQIDLQDMYYSEKLYHSNTVVIEQKEGEGK